MGGLELWFLKTCILKDVMVIFMKWKNNYDETLIGQLQFVHEKGMIML